MQKLSKKLVKKLIYEAIADVKKAGHNKIATVNDKGEAVDTTECEGEEDCEEKSGIIKQKHGLTQESINRIIREEVQAHYEAK
jgi:hypothetical protein